MAESNGSLPPGIWLTSPAGWLPRTGISSGTLHSKIEYGILLPSLRPIQRRTGQIRLSLAWGACIRQATVVRRKVIARQQVGEQQWACRRRWAWSRRPCLRLDLWDASAIADGCFVCISADWRLFRCRWEDWRSRLIKPIRLSSYLCAFYVVWL